MTQAIRKDWQSFHDAMITAGWEPHYTPDLFGNKHLVYVHGKSDMKWNPSTTDADGMAAWECYVDGATPPPF